MGEVLILVRSWFAGSKDTRETGIPVLAGFTRRPDHKLVILDGHLHFIGQMQLLKQKMRNTHTLGVADAHDLRFDDAGKLVHGGYSVITPGNYIVGTSGTLVKPYFLYNFDMPVDNDLYNRLAGTWWEEGSFLSILRIAVNPVRLEYLEDVVKGREHNSRRLSALDVGCGGGYLTEELAARGYETTGIDPAIESIRAADAHARQKGLEVSYKAARAESLPFPDNSFDLVTCCDVLEHVQDLDRILTETSRVLRPGGVFLFDTINRTFMTWLGVIFVAQEFPPTRFFPPKTHDWSMFIKPEELTDHLQDCGISVRDIRGMSSVVNPLLQFWLILRLKWKNIAPQEYGFRTRVRLSQDTTMNFIGHGIKE